MSNVESFLPEPLRRAADPDDYTLIGGRPAIGVQIGDLIIHSEDVWTDSEGLPLFSLISQATASTYDATLYPLLFEVIGTTSLTAITNVIGSTVPYKRVADYQGG